jgi:hypothetical protein
LLLRAYFCAEETPDFEQFTGSKYYTGFTEYIPKIRAALQSAKEKISDDHYQQYNNFLEILL